MDRTSVLAAFDAQVRRRVEADGAGGLAEADHRVVRWATTAGRGWCGIVWSDLDVGTADRVIAEQVAFFADRGEPFEWKLYSYDRPPDLAARLRAGGLVPGEEEALVVGETAEVIRAVGRSLLPDGVLLVPAADDAGIDLVVGVHDRVFGEDHGQLRGNLAAQLASAPDSVAMVVAMAGDRPVCSARVDFTPGMEFAGLWGGGTLPEWRGRGLYRSVVSYRARLAAARGYRYLQVDASPESRPILERLGFQRLAMTTPYLWSPR